MSWWAIVGWHRRDAERPDEILIVGGLPGPVRHATGRTAVSLIEWDRECYEPVWAFVRRVRREAGRAGVVALAFGTMP